MSSDPHWTGDEGLEPSRPPARFAPVRVWMLTETADLARVRGELLEAIISVHADDRDTIEAIPKRMVLVASELATNAMTHGLPPTIVRLLFSGREFLLEVADHGLSSVPCVAGQRAAGLGGFGLQIVRNLSRDFGWYATERGKHVWAVFAAQD